MQQNKEEYKEHIDFLVLQQTHSFATFINKKPFKKDMSQLILIRHGESRWNLDNKFTGWVDVPLSKKGIKEALLVAKELENVAIDVAFTSKLIRAHETLLLILARQQKTGIFLHKSKQRSAWSRHDFGKRIDINEIPVYSSDKLNERHYGKLQGMNKDDARRKWGEKQVFLWRRSYTARPPEGESLKDVSARVVPYFRKFILPMLERGKNVIISAHGNSLRALIKHIDDISDENIPHLELVLGKPIIYRLQGRKLIKVRQAHNFTRPLTWKEKRKREQKKQSKNKKNKTISKKNKAIVKKKAVKRKAPAKKRAAPKRKPEKRKVSKKKATTKKPTKRKFAKKK